jgi:hypothetical protein
MDPQDKDVEAANVAIRNMWGLMFMKFGVIVLDFSVVWWMGSGEKLKWR